MKEKALALLAAAGAVLFGLGALAARGVQVLGVRLSSKLLFWGFLALLLRALLRPAPRAVAWARAALARVPAQARFVVAVWAATRLGLMALSDYAAAVLPSAAGAPARSLLDLWTLNWDGGWYLEIAAHGYSINESHYSSVAFYPLWPLLIRGLGFLLGSPQLAGFLLAQALLLIGLFAVARLAELQLGRPAARQAVLWVLASPFAFFFTANYTESLFFCLVAWAFHEAAHGRRRAATVLGLLASLTRLPGVFLVVGLPLAELQRARASEPGGPGGPVRSPDPIAASAGFLRARAVYLLILLGPLAFSAYLWLSFGRFGAAFAAQAAWGRGLETGFHHWVRALEVFFRRPDDPRFVLFGFCVPLVVALAWLLRRLWDQRYLGYFAFTLLALLPGALLGLDSFGRFTIPCFTLAWPLAELSVRRPGGATLLLLLCALAQGLFATLFVLGYWMT